MAPHPRRAPLSGELAQRVVDLIAPTISHNINVMDEHGTIIACLDPDRLGTLHRGAQRVIAEGRGVLVTQPRPGTADRPGANEPLMVDGSLRGVVGVTGDPKEVAPLARIVALTVQLLIAQEHEQDTATRRHTEARDLVAALAAGTTEPAEAEARLRAAGLAPPWSLTLWADPEPRPDASAAPPYLSEAVAARVNALDGGRAAVLYGALWLVGSGAAAEEQQGLPPGTRRTATETTHDAAVLLAHAEESRALCRYAGLIPVPGGRPWSRELAVAVAHLPPRTLARLARTAAPLTAAQRESADAVATTASVQAAADALYVHRNTLLQRMGRIRSATGLDLRRADHLATLRMALYAHTALGG
ncbi:sugar diacid recognition domain-containing protein [Nocardiopsis sp. CNT312]|uniref:CdaR family transcriptional regulator n=1 Tax=Nocardiopsis sp. CNT312 TaxID=1137268 RepID=UPI0004B87339|nr:sugar diacid recognition domain-containing protein [Nocardiopsis sp. CNT312]